MTYRQETWQTMKKIEALFKDNKKPTEKDIKEAELLALMQIAKNLLPITEFFVEKNVSEATRDCFSQLVNRGRGL